MLGLQIMKWFISRVNLTEDKDLNCYKCCQNTHIVAGFRQDQTNIIPDKSGFRGSADFLVFVLITLVSYEIRLELRRTYFLYSK